MKLAKCLTQQMNDFSYTVKAEATENHSAIKLLTVTALQPVASPLMLSFSLPPDCASFSCASVPLSYVFFYLHYYNYWTFENFGHLHHAMAIIKEECDIKTRLVNS